MEALLASLGLEGHTKSFQPQGLVETVDTAACTLQTLDFLEDNDAATQLIQAAQQAQQEEELLHRRKVTIQHTWGLVEQALATDATKLFHQRLFERFPTVVPLFERVSMNVQADKFYKTISIAVKYLETASSLDPFFERLGKVHAKLWHCTPAHYEAMGECLLWTLETSLGENAWTDQVADAWTWLYGVVSSKMLKGAQDKANHTPTMHDSLTMKQLVETRRTANHGALLHRRKEMIKSTWRTVQTSLKKDNNEASHLFYQRLLQSYPDMAPFFKSTNMDAQTNKLFKTVNLAVTYVDHADCLDPVFAKLGEIHWNCKRRHYDAFGECLLWTLEKILGENVWDNKVADAWTWLYGSIAEKMITGE